MRATVEGAGVELAYRQAGSGAAVLLVHDMGRDAQSWASLGMLLADRARVVAYDRRGYAGSGAPEPYEGTTVYEQTEDAAAVIGGLELAPALVCGAGFGALVALDLASRHPRLVRSLVCVEPPLYAFVPEATEVLAAEREALRETVSERGPELAVQGWLAAHPATYTPAPAGADDPPPDGGPGGHGGPGGQECAEVHRAFFADFAGLSTWPVTRAQLRAIAVRVIVLTGPGTALHLDAAAEALAGLLPAVQRRLDGDLAAALRGLLD